MEKNFISFVEIFQKFNSNEAISIILTLMRVALAKLEYLLLYLYKYIHTNILLPKLVEIYFRNVILLLKLYIKIAAS